MTQPDAAWIAPSDHDDADAIAGTLRELEYQRCRAISELDLTSLKQLLDPELSHTHVNGMTQDRSAYLAALAHRPRATDAGPMRVRRDGGVAIVTGTITNSFTTPDGSTKRGTLHAVRVWRRDGNRWRLWAFAASGPLDSPSERRDG